MDFKIRNSWFDGSRRGKVTRDKHGDPVTVNRVIGPVATLAALGFWNESARQIKAGGRT
ncbi:MAG TPA: hypothetical protein VGC09_23325 [Rhodopila sp.]